jgi:hypothetical protein
MTRTITMNLYLTILYVLILLGPVAASRYAKMNITSIQVNYQLEPGTWGGQNIRLDITAEGGSLDFSCARGELSEPIKLDRQGHFDVRGSYTPEGHGPTRQGAEPVSLAAHYWGTVADDVMNLQVGVDGPPHFNGTYQLTRGRQGKVMKCG